MPTHYAFITSNNVARIRNEYDRLLATPADKLKPASRAQTSELTQDLTDAAEKSIAALESRGAWVEDSRLRDSDPTGNTRRTISTIPFIRHIETLSRFIGASK
jgi:hypothetical protein